MSKPQPSASQTSAPVAVAESGKTASGSESGVQVITRAAQLLRALGESHSSLSLSELASRLGLPRSTVHRLVVALEAEHLVGRAGERDGYRLGTVNVIDNRPREASKRQLTALEHLAAMVSDELELRLMVIRSAAAEQRMRESVH